MNNFDLKKFLAENKLTRESKLIEAQTPGYTVNGKKVDLDSIEIEGIDRRDYPDFVDAYIVRAEFEDGTELTPEEVDELQSENPELVGEIIFDKQLYYESVEEGQDSDLYLTAAEVADLVGNRPMSVYLKGRGTGRVQHYDNARQFLGLFDKHEPGLVYRQEANGMFSAKDPEPEAGKGPTSTAAPAKADYTSYYAKKGSGGFTGD
jgi:hypothetical protein